MHRVQVWAVVVASVAVGVELARADETATAGELVQRNRAALTLEGAELIAKVAQVKARSMGKNVNISVVDEGGHPIHFVRMNGARPASSYTAQTKAVAAATLRAPTGPFTSPAGDSNMLLLNFSLQNAAADGGGRMTSLLGGVPIVVDGQVVGAVGVGGATGAEDAEIAKAGIDALLARLK